MLKSDCHSPVKHKLRDIRSHTGSIDCPKDLTGVGPDLSLLITSFHCTTGELSRSNLVTYRKEHVFNCVVWVLTTERTPTIPGNNPPKRVQIESPFRKVSFNQFGYVKVRVPPNWISVFLLVSFHTTPKVIL